MTPPEVPTDGSASLTRVVTEADTAIALGSGDVPVLATPRLLAWLEAATLEALAGGLDPGRTSVGSRVDVTHQRPTPVGALVTVHAAVSAADGRLVRFAVSAEHRVGDADPVVVGGGEITRVVVDRDRFLARS